MAFVRMKGVPGLVFVPDDAANRPKKHPCPDCFDCQWCSDERCRLCRKRKACKGRCKTRGKSSHENS